MLMEQAVVFLVYSQDKQVLWPPQNRGQCHVTSLAVLQRDTGVDKQLPLDALAIVFAAKTKKVNFQRFAWVTPTESSQRIERGCV